MWSPEGRSGDQVTERRHLYERDNSREIRARSPGYYFGMERKVEGEPKRLFEHFVYSSIRSIIRSNFSLQSGESRMPTRLLSANEPVRSIKFWSISSPILRHAEFTHGGRDQPVHAVGRYSEMTSDFFGFESAMDEPQALTFAIGEFIDLARHRTGSPGSWGKAPSEGGQANISHSRIACNEPVT